MEDRLKNNSGFTLLEVLAATIVLAVLILISIKGYNVYLNKAKENYYKSTEDLLVQAARDFYSDNPNLLPQVPGETECVTAKALVDNKYIDVVSDYNNKKCDDTDSKVCVTKITSNDYTYYSRLSCFIEYKTNDYKSPTVEIEPKETDSIIVDKNKTHTVKAVVSYKEDNDLEESFLASYRYIIYKQEESSYSIYYDSNWVAIKEKETEKEIEIELDKSGTFYIEISAYNINGKSGYAKSGKITLDIEK